MAVRPGKAKILTEIAVCYKELNQFQIRELADQRMNYIKDFRPTKEDTFFANGRCQKMPVTTGYLKNRKLCNFLLAFLKKVFKFIFLY